jgi:hypothetical protein
MSPRKTGDTAWLSQNRAKKAKSGRGTRERLPKGGGSAPVSEKRRGTQSCPLPRLDSLVGSLFVGCYTQVSVTGLVSPFGFDAVQWKICVVTGWKISRVMSVSVSTGFTPDQFGVGQPAVAPDTVGAAVKVAGFVVKVRFPLLIALAGMDVSDVAGPARTLF